MADLFASPGEIRAELRNERLRQDALLSQTRPGVVVGGIFGRALQGEDPRLRRARALDEISQELTRMGLRPGDPDFTRELVPRVQARLGLQAALQAQQMALQAEQSRMAVRGVQQSAGAMQRSLERAGFPPAQAADLATDPKLARQVIASRLRSPEVTALQREAAAAFPGDQNAQQKAIRDILAARGRGQGITINIDKAAEAARVQTAKTRAAQAEEATEVQNAAAQLAGIAALTTPGSPISPTMRMRYDAARLRLGKAVAQLRNPGGTEASDAAAQAVADTLPGITGASLVPGMVQTMLRDIEMEAAQARGEIANPETRPEIRRNTPDFSGLPDDAVLNMDLSTLDAQGLEAWGREMDRRGL